MPVEAAVLGAIDYKMIMSATYETQEALDEAYSKCHKRSAERLLKALLANGGTLLSMFDIGRQFRHSVRHRRVHQIRPTHGVIVSTHRVFTWL